MCYNDPYEGFAARVCVCVLRCPAEGDSSSWDSQLLNWIICEYITNRKDPFSVVSSNISIIVNVKRVQSDFMVNAALKHGQGLFAHHSPSLQRRRLLVETLCRRRFYRGGEKNADNAWGFFLRRRPCQ